MGRVFTTGKNLAGHVIGQSLSNSLRDNKIMLGTVEKNIAYTVLIY